MILYWNIVNLISLVALNEFHLLNFPSEVIVDTTLEPMQIATQFRCVPQPAI